MGFNWKRVKRKYRRKKPVQKFLKRTARRIGLGNVLDPFLDEIRFSGYNKRTRSGRSYGSNEPDPKRMKITDYYVSRKKRARPNDVSRAKRARRNVSNAPLAIMDAADGGSQSFRKMPYGRKRSFVPTRFRRSKRRKLRRRHRSVSRKAIAKTVGTVLRKRGIGGQPRNRYSKMNFQQVTWNVNERGFNATSMLDWDGDLKGAILPNTQVAFFDDDAAAAGAKLALGDPGLDELTNKVPAKLHIIGCSRKLTYRNNCLNDVVCRFYIVAAKQDLDSNQTITNVWTSDLGSDVVARTNVTDANLDNTFTAGPLQSPDFKKKFKVISKGKRLLKPGGEMTLKMSVKNRELDLMQLHKRADDLSGDLNYIKGVTLCVYTVWQGTLGHDSTTTTNVGLLSGTVDIMDVINYTWKYNIGASAQYGVHYLDSSAISTGVQAGWNAELE